MACSGVSDRKLVDLSNIMGQVLFSFKGQLEMELISKINSSEKYFDLVSVQDGWACAGII